MLARARPLATAWPIAILLPGIAWLALDRAVWPWDQAWFAAHTLQLYETLRHDPLGWPRALADTTPLKPPAVAWIGQLFVPLGIALGSIDAGLLLSVWLTHAATLVLMFRVLMELSGGRALAAATGVLVAGSAPIFVVYSTQYLAEGAQTLAVAWFVFIMAAAPRWGRSRTAAQLVAATAFAMLAKTTSPLFCAGLGVVALVSMFRSTPRGPGKGARAPGPRISWAVAILLSVMAFAWYWTNFELVLLHVRTAAFGPVAEHYGRRDSFAAGFLDWWTLARAAFFLRPVALALVALAAIAAVRRWRGSASAPVSFDLAAAVSFVQVLITLALFSFSPNRDPRYLEPLLPLVAVVAAWVSAHAGRAAAFVLMAILVAHLALVQSQVLGLWPARPVLLRTGMGVDPALHYVRSDAAPAADLAAIARRTCPRGDSGIYHFVGVDLLALSGHALTYVAAKERLAGRAGECRYVSVAFLPVETVEIEVAARPYTYWIAADPQVRPIPAHFAFLNRSAPVVFERLRRSGALASEQWDGPPGIVLYRFVRP